MQLILFAIILYLLIIAIGSIAICECVERIKKGRNNIIEGEIESGE